MKSSQISVGWVVSVPSWPRTGDFTVTKDHVNEVTLSNGERIYKAKCLPNLRLTLENKKRAAEKILNKKK